LQRDFSPQLCYGGQIFRTFDSSIAVAIYSFLVSFFYVASLYVLVPKTVKDLSRDDVRHVKWRAFATSLVTIFSWYAIFPLFFCRLDGRHGSYHRLDSAALVTNSLQVLAHTASLFLGPLCALLLQTHLEIRYKFGQINLLSYGKCAINELLFIRTFSRSGGKWQAARDLIICPLSEELVFRGCIVPPIYYFMTCYSSSSTVVLRSTIICPLFFGTAHVHHAIQKVRAGHDLSIVLLGTIFQFAYTYLFGIYVTYVYIRIGFSTLTPLFLSHCFCNYMGVPNLAILDHASMKPFKIILIILYVIGIILFINGFSTKSYMILPLGTQ